jgi:hypothetical protein
LGAAGAWLVALYVQARDHNRRQMIEQCLPRDREEAEFFARCWTTGRAKH